MALFKFGSEVFRIAPFCPCFSNLSANGTGRSTDLINKGKALLRRQVQGQLEVCELDRCDFLECKLEEYICEGDYFEDNHATDLRLNKEGTEKGCVLVFRDRGNNDPKFIYSPIGITQKEYELIATRSKSSGRSFPF